MGAKTPKTRPLAPNYTLNKRLNHFPRIEIFKRNKAAKSAVKSSPKRLILQNFRHLNQIKPFKLAFFLDAFKMDFPVGPRMEDRPGQCLGKPTQRPARRLQPVFRFFRNFEGFRVGFEPPG